MNEESGGGCPPPGINTEVDEVAGGIPHLLGSKRGQTKEVETLERERRVTMERDGEVPPECVTLPLFLACVLQLRNT